MRLLLAAILAVAALPVHAAEPWAVTQVKPTDPFERWYACLVEKAKRLDDGITDAGVVAAAISLECAEDYRGTIREQTGGDPARMERLEAQLEAKGAAKETAALVVLRGRAASRDAELRADLPN